MCGIAGAITKKSDLPIGQMLSRISHRGPNDEGSASFCAGDYSVTLGHRRLSIIDLSPAGHQPMSTPDGRFSIIYNGELYNFPEVKKELEALGVQFRSKTDTEVILESHARWGRDAISRFNGMFAYALWDDREKKLLLVRDHAGQKPLYYAPLSDGGIVFASEIKSLLASALIAPAVNENAIAGYLGSLRVHAPDTLFSGIKKLPAGSFLEWSDGVLTVGRWWNPLPRNRFQGSFNDAADAFFSLFSSAVRRHMIADVPVGAFLSGGLDSSLIVALAAGNAKNPLITFTTGFSENDQARERGKNELFFSRLLRDTLGTQIDYREIILSANITRILPDIIWHLDEPIADPAEINAYLICQAAREQGITVLLSGMGADEIFAGYNHHLLAWHTRFLDALGNPGKRALAGVFSTASLLPLGSLARYARRKGPFLQLSQRERILGLMSWQTEKEIDALLAPHLSSRGYLDAKKSAFDEHPQADLLNRILYADTKTFLSEHNLMYTDKMSMASSCEVRSPFLDKEVMEFAFSLPPHYKINRWSSKDVVKRAASPIILKKIAYQKKSGFSAPVHAWKKAVQTLAREHLARNRACMAYFNTEIVNDLVTRHAQTGEGALVLWQLITFALWHEQFIESHGNSASMSSNDEMQSARLSE